MLRSESPSTLLASRSKLDHKHAEMVESVITSTEYHLQDQAKRLDRLVSLLDKWDKLGLARAGSEARGDGSRAGRERHHQHASVVMHALWGVTSPRDYPTRSEVIAEVEALRAGMEGRTFAGQGAGEGHWADVVPSSLREAPLRTEIELQQTKIDAHIDELRDQEAILTSCDPLLKFDEDADGERWKLVAPDALKQQQAAIKIRQRHLRIARARLKVLQTELEALPIDVDDDGVSLQGGAYLMLRRLD